MTDEVRAPTRLQEHARLSTALAALTDDELRALLGERKARGFGWGDSGAIEFEDTKLFVKRIPVTDVEIRYPSGTKNHYDIPTYYNYGVGSAGFGVFREVATHVKTTLWVEEGACAHFPFLYHHRVLPLPEPWSAIDEGRQGAYVRHWNSAAGVDRYMRDRAAARHEAVIALEHVPYTMAGWLADNPGRVEDVLNQLFETVAFLRSHGIVHFDAHFQNVVTDGKTHCLTDYGLVLDSEFQLTDDERAFLERHWDYDYGEVLMSTGAVLGWMLQRRPEDERKMVRSALAIDESKQWYEIASTLVSRVEDLAGLMSLDPAFVGAITRYRPVILFMDAFLEAQRANPRKDTPYDEPLLRHLLEDAGVLSRGN